MDTEGSTIKASSLPTNVIKLENPDQYQQWEREIKTYLVHVDLWKFTLMSKSVLSLRAPDETPEAFETREEKWEGKHLKCCNAIQSTLGLNYYNDHKGSINAYFLWVAIQQGCKPRGSGSLNNRYRRLLALKLSDF